MPATVEAAAAKAAGSWANVTAADARVAMVGTGSGAVPQPTKDIALKTSILKANFFMIFLSFRSNDQILNDLERTKIVSDMG
jgi:stage V sporulation protein SpoVS